MTRKLYDENSYLTEFNATVSECENYNNGYAVVLDKTAFFPEGGGQLSDRGSIDNAIVSDVQIGDQKIYHITDTPLAVGSTVTGVINWERRFDFMQQHSAEHIVSGVAHRIFGCENVGFHLSENIVTLDFDKPLTGEQILRVEREANKRVFENVGFRCYYPDGEILGTLEYRSKKELEGAVRIVEIESTDMCACCAPHVKSAGEIGLIKLLDTEKLRGGVRIELKAGMRALEDYNNKYKNVREISALLAVAGEDAALGVNRLMDNLGTIKAENTALKQERIKFKVEGFEPRNEATAVFEEDLSIKDLQAYADGLCRAYGGIRGVFSATEKGHSFCICGDPERLDGLFARFKKEFSVKGGGRNGMVQGTVLAESEKIANFFK